MKTETCNNCRWNDVCDHTGERCDGWGARKDNPNYIVAGQVWGPKDGGGSREVMVDYVNHKDDKSLFAFIIVPTWCLDYGWYGGGLAHWGKDGGYLYTEDEALKIMKEHNFVLRNDHHMEWVPNDEERPPAICRQVFGRMDECHEEAGIENPWSRMPDSWKEKK
jgi:hypothetical protein